MESTINDIEFLSQWKDRSREMFTMNDDIKDVFSEYEYRDLLEQIERLIVSKVVKLKDEKKDEKKEENKLNRLGNKLDKQIESKQFESKVNLHLNLLKYSNYYVYIDCETCIYTLKIFKSNSIKSVIDYILNNIELFKELFFCEDMFIPIFLNEFYKPLNMISYYNCIYILKDGVDRNDIYKDEKLLNTTLNTIRGKNDREQFTNSHFRKVCGNFFIEMDNDKILEMILNYYRENSYKLLQEIYDSDNYQLLNAKDHYLYLDINDIISDIDKDEKIINIE